MRAQTTLSTSPPPASIDSSTSSRANSAEPERPIQRRKERRERGMPDSATPSPSQSTLGPLFIVRATCLRLPHPDPHLVFTANARVRFHRPNPVKDLERTTATIPRHRPRGLYHRTAAETHRGRDRSPHYATTRLSLGTLRRHECRSPGTGTLTARHHHRCTTLPFITINKYNLTYAPVFTNPYYFV